jgi:hypothetical protein
MNTLLGGCANLLLKTFGCVPRRHVVAFAFIRFIHQVAIMPKIDPPALRCSFDKGWCDNFRPPRRVEAGLNPPRSLLHDGKRKVSAFLCRP